MAQGEPIESLMQQIAEGDEAALRELVVKLRPRVLRFLTQLGADKDAAEDLCQETLIRLWVARRRYEPKGKLVTFVLKIAYRCLLNRRSKAGHRREVADDSAAERLVDPSRSPEEWVLAAYRRRQIRTAIDRLPDGQREVFVMAQLQDMPYAEIAEVLDLPVGTVKSRMARAVGRLRELLAHSL